MGGELARPLPSPFGGSRYASWREVSGSAAMSRSASIQLSLSLGIENFVSGDVCFQHFPDGCAAVRRFSERPDQTSRW
jgi:hypothetical protein